MNVDRVSARPVYTAPIRATAPTASSLTSNVDVPDRQVPAPRTPSAKVSISQEARDAQRADVDGRNSEDEKSPVKSLIYGTVGLPDPVKAKKEPENGFYTAGRWLAAAATVGGLIALIA